MKRVPMPIIMAMVAGVFLQFGLNLILAIRDGIAVALPMAAIFLVLSAMPRLARMISPSIGALIAGIVATGLSTGFDLQGPVNLTIAKASFYLPEFSWPAMLELVLPLAVTVLAAQNAQGIAVLEAVGHNPPVNAITAACGIGSLISALFGGVSTCFTGPANAILVSGGEKDKQYVAGVIASILAMLFGLLSATFTQLMLTLPKVFIAALAGLALLRVLERSFVVSFSGRFTFGAVISFLVTVANVPVFSIGAPFWAVLVGLAVSWMIERDDFARAAER